MHAEQIDNGNSSRGPYTFTALDPSRPITFYRRCMPHWRQDGATYFVTTRLNDSVPLSVWREWKEHDRTWLRNHGVEVPVSHQRWKQLYEQIPEEERSRFEARRARRLHVELDNISGSCHLRSPDAQTVVREAVQFFDGERYALGDLVIMPNHIHLLVKPIADFPLEKMLHSIKGFSSRKLTRNGLKQGKMWQTESYDRIVRNSWELCRFRRYIQENPTKAKLPEGDYTYCRAKWMDDFMPAHP